ncbi:hypothetical protein [Aquibacillus rhizosphaerae]|uniref:Uncharacterized protein n=1 Tax=Aquibacillus rhizosphaerae TaxID=3051431 RepID=A0ABT7L3L2_9BACI|nr:hypothetical protein [Aquibacillus sp. LR5S19]MDL4839959.1 hypothetical protein [Aquibacillus sp. LR5S19]
MAKPIQSWQDKEKKDNVYLVLFMVAAIINTIYDLFYFGLSVRVVIFLLFYIILFYLGLRRARWAEVLIKIYVWVTVISIILFPFFN